MEMDFHNSADCGDPSHSAPAYQILIVCTVYTRVAPVFAKRKSKNSSQSVSTNRKNPSNSVYYRWYKTGNIPQGC